MKKQLILATTFAMFAISCSKPNDLPPQTNGYFRGKVDGVFFSDSTSANISIQTIPGWGPWATYIRGRYGDGQITLELISFPSTGERVLDQANTSDYITISRDSGGFFVVGSIHGGPTQGSGKINILEVTSDYIKGTFECIAPADSTAGIFPPMSITEGEFNLKYQR